MERLDLLLAFTLASDAHCIDVGANVGDVLARLVARAPHGRHIAYEPLPDLAAALARCFPHVDVRVAAAAEGPGRATFHRPRRAHTRSTLMPQTLLDEEADRLDVRLEDLDAHLPPDFAPAFIKIDVEGAEQRVLEGARATLARHRPIVVFEHGAAAGRAGEASSRLHRLLKDAGLAVWDIDGGGPYDAAGFVEVVRGGRLWTFVARPDDLRRHR